LLRELVGRRMLLISLARDNFRRQVSQRRRTIREHGVGDHKPRLFSVGQLVRALCVNTSRIHIEPL
jgi:hypothetical protein